MKSVEQINLKNLSLISSFTEEDILNNIELSFFFFLLSFNQRKLQLCLEINQEVHEKIRDLCEI